MDYSLSLANHSSCLHSLKSFSIDPLPFRIKSQLPMFAHKACTIWLCSAPPLASCPGLISWSLGSRGFRSTCCAKYPWLNQGIVSMWTIFPHVFLKSIHMYPSKSLHLYPSKRVSSTHSVKHFLLPNSLWIHNTWNIPQWVPFTEHMSFLWLP